MTPLFKKLNYKDQQEVYILNAPDSFRDEMDGMEALAHVKTRLDKKKEIRFMLCFVQTRADVEAMIGPLSLQAGGDGVIWFAYPKGSSRSYSSEISRDQGWEPLGTIGFEAVRAVAIDQDWSALRFRRVEFIKTMSRRADFAMTREGKKKTRLSGR
jgi:hypothetical protein